MSKESFIRKVSELALVESPQEIMLFLEENDCDILENVILNSVIEVKKQPYLKRMSLSFFECPFDKGGDAVCLNADFNIPDYASVYRIESEIFEKTVNPYFKKLDFKFLLSFDNIE